MTQVLLLPWAYCIFTQVTTSRYNLCDWDFFKSELWNHHCYHETEGKHKTLKPWSDLTSRSEQINSKNLNQNSHDFTFIITLSFYSTLILLLAQQHWVPFKGWKISGKVLKNTYKSEKHTIDYSHTINNILNEHVDCR